MNKIKRLFSCLFGDSEKEKMRDKILSEEIDFGKLSQVLYLLKVYMMS